MSAEPLSATAPIEHKLPEGWREVPLASVAEVRFSGVNKLSLPSEKPVRLCNYTDVYNNDYITGGLEFMRATATQPEVNRFGLQLGDVIITKDSETPDDIGIAAVVDYTAPDLLCGYHLALIRPRTGEVDPTFLAKQLRNHRLARYFGQRANGLTRYGLPTAVVASAPLWIPEPAQQRAIGGLLRLVDEAIAKTEAVIAKLKQVRAGLLHDLLTRGLDEHGQLRDPIAHSEQFKDSPLGRIPNQWSVRSLEQVTDPSAPICYGIVQAFDFVPDGVPVLAIRDILGDYTTRLHRAAPRIDANYKRSRVCPGDVLISIKGTIARIGLVPGHYVGNISRDLARIRPVEGVISEFLVHLLRSPLGQKTLELAQVGTTRAELSIAPLKRLPFAFPLTNEQKLIAELLDRQDLLISAHEVELAKLIDLKSGLSSDLLTGRVRVPEGIEVGS